MTICPLFLRQFLFLDLQKYLRPGFLDRPKCQGLGCFLNPAPTGFLIIATCSHYMCFAPVMFMSTPLNILILCITLVLIEIRWWISTQRRRLQPWTSAETRTPRWAPEIDPQWRPCLLDGHRDKTTGTRRVLCTIWLCCSLDLNWPEENDSISTHYFPSKYRKADVTPLSLISSWCNAALTQFALLKALYK